ncbi:MAG TPA: hypothetical protein VL357_05960 [Rariglobus sp.]|jgi:hypothetical protein|nr:hypothetical protein [Rariglobus sp.]
MSILTPATDRRPGPAPEAFTTPQVVPVIGTRPGVAVEIAPGKRMEITHPEPLEQYCIAELVPLGGGTYRVVPRLATLWLPVGKVALQKLGLTISEKTLHVLGRAGFIKVRQISISRYDFNLQSWLAHCAAVEADPEFWDAKVQTGAGLMTNRQRYLKAIN